MGVASVDDSNGLLLRAGPRPSTGTKGAASWRRHCHRDDVKGPAPGPAAVRFPRFLPGASCPAVSSTQVPLPPRSQLALTKSSPVCPKPRYRQCCRVPVALPAAGFSTYSTSRQVPGASLRCWAAPHLQVSAGLLYACRLQLLPSSLLPRLWYLWSQIFSLSSLRPRYSVASRPSQV